MNSTSPFAAKLIQLGLVVEGKESEMAFIHSDYVGRLPYGLWFDEESDTEYLFDRGYCGLASRSEEKPWKVTLLERRRYVGGSSESWFYHDGTSPRMKTEYLRRSERILCKFMLGHDVRGFIRDKSAKPETGGKYLPQGLRPHDPRIDLIADS